MSNTNAGMPSIRAAMSDVQSIRVIRIIWLVDETNTAWYSDQPNGRLYPRLVAPRISVTLQEPVTKRCLLRYT